MFLFLITLNLQTITGSFLLGCQTIDIYYQINHRATVNSSRLIASYRLKYPLIIYCAFYQPYLQLLLPWWRRRRPFLCFYLSKLSPTYSAFVQGQEIYIQALRLNCCTFFTLNCLLLCYILVDSSTEVCCALMHCALLQAFHLSPYPHPELVSTSSSM